MNKTNRRIYYALFAWKFATYDHKIIEYLNACMYSIKSASTNGFKRVNTEHVLRVVTKIEARIQGLLVGSPMLLQEDQRLHSRLLILSLGDHQIVLILEMSHFQD